MSKSKKTEAQMIGALEQLEGKAFGCDRLDSPHRRGPCSRSKHTGWVCTCERRCAQLPSWQWTFGHSLNSPHQFLTG